MPTPAAATAAAISHVVPPNHIQSKHQVFNAALQHSSTTNSASTSTHTAHQSAAGKPFGRVAAGSLNAPECGCLQCVVATMTAAADSLV